MQEKTFDAFIAAVKSSVENHAKRKNYTDGGADAPNQLADVMKLFGIHEQHGIGEIIYKAKEFLTAPPATKKILMEKVAGWAFMLWKTLPDAEQE